MSTWSEGYVTEIGYTHGYFAEFNPMYHRLAILNKGYALPSSGKCHCELGFGQGISINYHAAAGGASWYGTDFMPGQVHFAKELAKASGAEVHLYDDSFAEFNKRTDLPQFDSIGLHGIWAWVSKENQEIIVEFIKKHLKVGGLLYISYNTQPGWSTFAPMRHLLAEHARTMGVPSSPITTRVENSLEFAQALMKTKTLYQQSSPVVEMRLDKLQSQNSTYVAHEYFNGNWDPMYFSEICKALSPAKLNFICSANYMDHIDDVNLTPEQSEFLAKLEDQSFRESTRDFMVNQQFRRDYWMRGGRKLSQPERIDAIRETSVVLVVAPGDVSFKLKGSRGDFAVGQANLNVILEKLYGYLPKTLGQLEIELKETKFGIQEITKIVLSLVAMGAVAIAQEPEGIEKAKEASKKLNRHVLQQVRYSEDYRYLASPVTGGGISVDRTKCLLMLAIINGHAKNDEIADFVAGILISEGKSVIKGGKPIGNTEELKLELQRLATDFLENKLPMYRALQVI